MIDLKKKKKVADKVARFLANLSDVSKDWYLVEFQVIFSKFVNYFEKLGLTYDFCNEMNDEEMIVLNDVMKFVQKLNDIKEEVLNK